VASERLVVVAPETLDDLNMLLHDSYADQDLVRFDERAGRLEFPAAQEIDTWREVPNGFPRTRGTKRGRLSVSTLQIPFLQVNLLIESVRDIALGPARVADPWILNEAAFDRSERRLTLDPVTGPQLTVDVETLRIEAEITSHVAIIVRRRVLFFGIESDSPEREARFRWPPNRN